MCYTDGSGLEDKAAGAYIRKCHLGFHEDKAESEYLGTSLRAPTHYGGELSGIAQALEGTREVNTPAILMDSKSAISAIKKLGKGLAPPRSAIEARVHWRNFARGHLRGLGQGSQLERDQGQRRSRQTLQRSQSILGYEAERVVTPASLRAW